MPKKPDPKSNDLAPRSMLPKHNAVEQKYLIKKASKKAPPSVQSRNYHKSEK